MTLNIKTPIPLTRSLLVSAVVLAAAGTLPSVAAASAPCHVRQIHHTSYRAPVRHHARTVVRTRTVVVHDVRTVYVRQPARVIYVQPRPVAVRYYDSEPVRQIAYREHRAWSRDEGYGDRRYYHNDRGDWNHGYEHRGYEHRGYGHAHHRRHDGGRW